MGRGAVRGSLAQTYYVAAKLNYTSHSPLEVAELTEELAKFAALVSAVRNPWGPILDRVGLRRSPYEVRHKDGHLIELRPRSGDLFGFYEILLRGDYTAAGQNISNGDVVIDVGANIGCFTILASRAVGSTGRVIAIEPDAANFRQLVHNIALNRLTNVTALNIALGATDGLATLYSPKVGLFSSIFASVNGQPVIGMQTTVPMMTLRSLMSEQGVANCKYLKLDCEGAEHLIVEAMSPDLARRIPQITVEIHKVSGFDARMFSAKLEGLGYRLQRGSKNGRASNVAYYCSDRHT